MDSPPTQQLHFLLIPLMAQSHIIPLTDFAKLLGRRGVTVSIITTPLNAVRYSATIKHAVESGMRIQMIPLEFPGQEFGIPDGCENLDTLTSMHLTHKFLSACAKLKDPLEKLMEELIPKPSCIVSTNALPWTQQVADKFHIPRYIFETISCFAMFSSQKRTEVPQEDGAVEPKRLMVSNAPDKIQFSKDQVCEGQATSKGTNSFSKVLDDMKRSKSLAQGTVVNSFVELEKWYVEEMKRQRRHVWCIGPVSLCNKDLAEKSDRGNKASLDDHYCTSWLDSMKPRSVVYVCFGSLCRLSAAQIKELGLGLEASNFPFVWIIRGLDCSEEVLKWLDEEKFEERVRGRGLIIRGWAPQVLILSHPSVGGFLTHCGWNSTLEGVSAGLPMITWPMFAEQFYNEKFIVQILGIGVSVGVEVLAKPGAGVDEQSKAIVKSDHVKKAVEDLMVETEEGRERRERARKLGEMAKDALEQGGSSDSNISLLIKDVMSYSIE